MSAMCTEVEEGGPESTLLLANALALCAFQGGLLEVTGRHGHNYSQAQVSQQQKTYSKHGREKEGEKEKRRKNIQYV
jgi:hypothetical protein